MNIISWNVNGIRAIYKKNFTEWFKKNNPDILCLQETRARLDQIPKELLNINGYYPYISAAQKGGYSGVGLWTKIEPKNIETKINIEKFDNEGRIIRADYDDFILFNIYFPNGRGREERLDFKLEFYDTLLKKFNILKDQGHKIIICGDFNTAHKEIDLSRPKENEMFSGFLTIERQWIDKLISCGFLDTFRMFNQDPDNYTWWDFKTRARGRNIGWRIDYFFISNNLKENIKSAFINSDDMGSDHCPIGLTL